MPYPWEFPCYSEFEVQSVDAEGHELLAGAVVIDSVERTVTIPLTEYADIQAVRVTAWKLNDGSSFADSSLFNQPLDLSKPLEVTLEKYERDITWTIQATQTIQRQFEIASQIGAPEIDPELHTVKTLVPMQQSLESILVRQLKLAGPLATYEPELVGQHVDFSQPVQIDVTEFGRTTQWTITVEQTDVSVVVDRVDAWTQVAWIYASAEIGKQNGFEYRKSTDDEWTVVPQDWINHDGGAFNCCLRHLDAETQYIVRATSDEDHSAEIEFTTASIIQLPNSQFTQWSIKTGSAANRPNWQPWGEDQTPFWGNGNTGAVTMGPSNSLPIDDPDSPTGYQGAELKTEFKGVGAFGKLAAGNLFAGEYVKTVGTNGVLSFGREFTGRPTGLRAVIQYTTAPITDYNKSNPDFSSMKDQPDTCIVWCALTNASEPLEIRTAPSNRQLFDRNADDVIAYGQYQSGSDTPGLITVTIKLDYKATDIVPTYIMLTASASKYGDFFTGGRGARMIVKSYELLYDYIE